MTSPRTRDARDVHVLDRRRFLYLLGGLGGAVVLSSCTRTSVASGASGPANASGASAAAAGNVLVVSDRVVLRRSRDVAGVVVEPGGELVFDPGKEVVLRSTGNVVVRGRLTMRPESSRVLHRIVFTGVNESNFVGGGMDVLDSDVGLWVMGRGALDVVGTRRRAWTRALGDVAAGTDRIDVEHDPVGWEPGDELLIAPTGRPSSDHSTAFDVVRVAAVDGRSVRLRDGTRFEHPAVGSSDGGTFTAEVMNLTRNVRIEGTAGGRAHVFVRSGRPQRVRNAALRHVGPAGVLGRYGLHFHHSENGTRRSLVHSVVVREAGSHAFVPHSSHGIRFRDCISYDTVSDAYWWDLPDATNDTLYHRCVAALVHPEGGDRGLRLTAFSMNNGRGNVAHACVAVGVQGDKSASGYHWPEGSQGSGVWTFEDNIAHNNRVDGIFVWQNDESRHVVDGFIAYRNGTFGIEHGAYFNRYQYRDALLLQNGQGGVLNHARSVQGSSPVTFERVIVEDSPVGFLEGRINDNAIQNPPAIVCGATFRDVGIDVDDGTVPSQTFDVRANC